MKSLSSILVFVALLNFSFAQEAGKIFNNTELLKLFGEVKQSVDFETKELKKLILLSGEYIMFRIINDDIVILDQYRQQLYPYQKNVDFDNNTVFKFFSVTVLHRLLQSANYHKVIFEEREKTLVVRYKNKSMERGVYCPPFCREKKFADNYIFINYRLVSSGN